MRKAAGFDAVRPLRKGGAFGMAALCLILLALTAGLVPNEAWAAKKAAAPKPAAGKFITVEAEGYAPIVDGAKNKAREDAKRSVMREALEKALGASTT